MSQAGGKDKRESVRVGHDRWSLLLVKNWSQPLRIGVVLKTCAVLFTFQSVKDLVMFNIISYT